MKGKFFFSGIILLFLSYSLSFGQSKMGVNVSGGFAFVNIADEGLTFNNATSLDAQGWPNSDFLLNMDFRLVAEWVGTVDDPAAYRINKSGIYHCSFIGQASLSGVTITNQVYNAGTNTTTFDLTIPATNNGCIFWQLYFTNTKRTAASATNTGITSLKMNRPGYAVNTTKIFTDEYINLLKSADFACYRYYPVNNVWDGDPVYPATTTWANRKLPTDANQGNMRPVINKSEGWCWEYVILLANTINKDIWININSSADDNYITQLATKLKNELNPGINIYIEYCNEAWGSYNIGTNWIGAQATAMGLSYDQNYARNCVRISNLFKAVYGAAAINTKIRMVLGAQEGWDGRSDTHLNYVNTTFGPPKNFLYAIAPATYYSGFGATIDDALNACHTEIMNHYDDPADGSSLALFAKKATTWGMKLVSYEGQESNNIGDVSNLAVDIGKIRVARMASEQYCMFQQFFDAGAVLACQFAVWSNYTRYGSWGLTDDPYVPDRNYKFKAARTLAGNAANTMPVAAPPLAPTCLTPTVIDATHTKLTWVDNATTEEGYEIWYKESVYNVWKYYSTVTANTTTTNFTFPVAGKTYTFRVRAYNFSQWSAFDQPCAGGDIQPPTPATLSTTGQTSSTVSLSWTGATDNVGVTGYDLYCGSTKINTTLIVGTTYTVSGLLTGMPYTFIVKAHDAAGNVSLPSNVLTASTTVADIQAPTAPTLSTTGKTTTTVALSWAGATDNVGVTGYDVYQGATLVGTTASTTFTVTGLTPSTAYTFTVKAKDAAGNVSPASNSLGVTTDTPPDTQAPTAPTLSTTGKTTTTVALSWAGATDNVGVTGYDVYQGATLVGTTASTTFTVTGLTPSTAYTFTVKAKDAAGNVSPASNSLGVTTNTPPDTQAPTAPTLSTTGKTTTTVALSWAGATDNVGVTGYDVYQGATLVGTTASTTFTVTGLTPSTAYTFTVKAKDAAGNISPASNSLAVTTNTPPDTQAPTAPTLSTTGKTTTTVALSWAGATDNVGVTGYDVYQGATLVGTTASTTFTVTGLTPSTAYTFTVKAKDAAGNVSPASNSLGVTTDTPPDTQAPTAPTLSTTGKTTTTVALSWAGATDNVGVTGYDVYQGATLVGTTASTTFTVTGLTPSTAYTFTVKAKDAAGNVSPASNSLGVTTNTAPDTQAPTAPTLSTTGKTTTTVALSWSGATDNVGVTGYDVYQGATLVGTTASTTFTVTGLTPSTAYTFTVKAKDAAGNVSPASNSLGVTTNTAPDTQAPTAPTLSTTGKTTTTVALSWAGATDNVGVTGYDVYQGATLVGTTASTTFTVTGLTPSTAYTFTVKAKDAAGNVSPASNSLGVTTNTAPDTQAPTAPTLSTTGKTTTTVALSWAGATDNVGVTGYDVYQGATLVGTTASTTFTVTGLTPSTAYTFTVKAKDAAGNISPASNSLGVTTNTAPDTQAPTAPTLSTTGKTTTTVALSWAGATDNVGVTGYDVYQGATLVGTTASTTFTVTGLTPSTAYTFTVKAKDAAGNVSPASNSLGVTTNTPPDTQAPTAPTLSTTGKTTTTVALSWAGATDNVGVTGYDVYQGATLVGTTASTTFTVTGLTPSTAYTFTVKAKDAAGNVSVASNSLGVTTNTAPDTQAPTAPMLSTTGKTTTTVALSWAGATDNVGVTGYDVYQGATLVGTTASTTFTVTGLTPSTAYTFTVKAKDAAGNVSVASNSLGVTTNTPTDTQAPTAPTLSSTDKTTTTVSLSWTVSTDNVGVTGYDVYNGTKKVNTTPITGNVYTVSNLTSNKIYTFTVIARDAAGNITSSNMLAVTTISTDTDLPVPLDESVSVSPNPTEGIFILRIENEDVGSYVLEIYDVLGKSLIVKTIQKETIVHETYVDLSDQPFGVYYVVLQCGKSKVVKKVIKI